MPTDQANDKPGPMGWGHDDLPEEQLVAEEQIAFETLGALVPQRLARSAPKTPNDELIAKVKEIQSEHGIDDGWWFDCLGKAVFGEHLPFKRQIIGSCVASGDMRATVYRMMAEVFLLNDPEELPGVDITGRDNLAFFAPYSYRAGRKIAGLNRGDGSLCVPHIRGKMQYGHLPCSTPDLKSDEFPEPQSSNAYREWGNSDRLLERFAPVAKKYTLLESERVRNAGDAKELLTKHFKPLNICSSWSFTPDYQHSAWEVHGERVWIYQRGRSPWHHNMTVAGWAIVDTKEFAYIKNSWGPHAHKNGDGFWIPASLLDSWLSNATCQSVGEIDLTDNAPAFPQIST